MKLDRKTKTAINRRAYALARAVPVEYVNAITLAVFEGRLAPEAIEACKMLPAQLELNGRTK